MNGKGVFKSGINIVAYDEKKSSDNYNAMMDYIKEHYTAIRYDSDSAKFTIESNKFVDGIDIAVFNETARNIWIADVRACTISKKSSVNAEDDIIKLRKQNLETIYNALSNITKYGIICIIVTDYIHEGERINLESSFSALTASNIILINVNDVYRVMKGSTFEKDLLELEELFWEQDPEPEEEEETEEKPEDKSDNETKE